MSHKRVIKGSRARRRGLPVPRRAGRSAPRHVGRLRPGHRRGPGAAPQLRRAGKEGGRSSPTGMPTLPSSFPSRAGMRPGQGPGAGRQGRGWRARGPSVGRCPPDPARRRRSGPKRRDSREGRREGKGAYKDLALGFSAVSLVGRGGTYDLALDQISSWSGQTSVQNTLRGRADQMGPPSKHELSVLF